MLPNRAGKRRTDLTGLADRVEQVDRLLPQTQCRRCGFQGCLPYAEAIAAGRAPINRCPPGGDETIGALARLLDTEVVALDPACGATQARRVARIDNSLCIGCTKCILACPVDAIVGAPRYQHHVLADRCTGCDLCLPPCPVDCITMDALGAPWSDADAGRARENHRARLARLAVAAPRPAQMPGTPETPGTLGTPGTQPASRDPLVALSAPAQKSRRLAQILERARRSAPR